jgi:sugar transferase (PEP-CTERM system associated)
MVKLFNMYFPKRTILLLISEGGLIFMVLVASVFICLGANAESAFRGQHGFVKIALVGAICFLCVCYSDLYDPAIISNRRKFPARLIRGLGIACLMVAALYYTFPSSEICRGFAIVGISLTGLSLIAYRQMFFAFNNSDRLAETALIMGEGPLAVSLAREIQTRPELGLRLAGYLGKPWDSGPATGAQRLGSIDDLREIVSRVPIQRIIVAMDNRRNMLPVQELLDLKTSGVTIQEGSDFYEITTGKLPIDTLRLSWLIFSPGFQVSKLTLLYKRLVSVALAGFAIIILLPVMAVVAAAIWIDSRGPIIFRQLRIGEGGLSFVVYKFRTMREDADLGRDPLPVQKNDVRITRVGRWLRRFRLDEIPQLYNILLGQMYFIGPRPFVPSQELELAHRIPLYTQRWTVKPGATGWAQVMRGYCVTLEDNNEKLAYDLFYIKNMSVALDLLILFKTIKIVLLGRGGR